MSSWGFTNDFNSFLGFLRLGLRFSFLRFLGLRLGFSFLRFLGLGLGFSFLRFVGLGLGLGLGLNKMDLAYVCMS